MEKFLAASCSYEKVQLGIKILTRYMAVGLRKDKRNKMVKEFSN